MTRLAPGYQRVTDGRRQTVTSAGSLDFLLIAPARDLADLTRVADACIAATARTLGDDEDDLLTSHRRGETLRRLGVPVLP